MLLLVPVGIGAILATGAVGAVGGFVGGGLQSLGEVWTGIVGRVLFAVVAVVAIVFAGAVAMSLTGALSRGSVLYRAVDGIVGIGRAIVKPLFELLGSLVSLIPGVG